MNSINSLSKISELGSGLHGKVYLCSYKNNKYALKETKITNKFYSTETLNEINMLLLLKGIPEVVSLHSYWHKSDKDYLLLEHCDISLSDIIHRMTESKRIEQAPIILNQIGSALQKITSLGFVHMDVKLNNILVTKNPLQFKLCDFGLSTTAYGFINGKEGGTFKYMAPEILLDSKRTYTSSTKVDIWSLGITICRYISGNKLHRDIHEKNCVKWIFQNSISNVNTSILRFEELVMENQIKGYLKITSLIGNVNINDSLAKKLHLMLQLNYNDRMLPINKQDNHRNKNLEFKNDKYYFTNSELGISIWYYLYNMRFIEDISREHNKYFSIIAYEILCRYIELTKIGSPFDIWKSVENIKLLSLLTFKDDIKIKDIKNSYEILEIIKYKIINPNLLNVFERVYNCFTCPLPTVNLDTWFTIPLISESNNKNKKYIMNEDMLKYREDIVNLILNDYDNEPVDIFRMCKYLNEIVSKNIKYKKEYLYNTIKKICIDYRKGKITVNDHTSFYEKIINITNGIIPSITYNDYFDVNHKDLLYILLSSQYNIKYMEIEDKKFVNMCTILCTNAKIKEIITNYKDIYMCLTKLKNTRWSNKSSYRNLMNKLI